MERTFAQTLSALRRQKNLNQRTVALDLGISQALLSHYENGIREPGLGFVVKACDFYHVSADYLLCRSDSPNAAASTAEAAVAFLEQIRGVTDRAEMALKEFMEKQL